MRSEWSAQRARRVGICAVLAIHVPNQGIHTRAGRRSWRRGWTTCLIQSPSGLEMALIMYNPKITEMEVRRWPDRRPRRSGGETGMEDREGDEQRDRLMARRCKRIRQI